MATRCQVAEVVFAKNLRSLEAMSAVQLSVLDLVWVEVVAVADSIVDFVVAVVDVCRRSLNLCEMDLSSL